jgi:hypothetical protein
MSSTSNITLYNVSNCNQIYCTYDKYRDKNYVLISTDNKLYSIQAKTPHCITQCDINNGLLFKDLRVDIICATTIYLQTVDNNIIKYLTDLKDSHGLVENGFMSMNSRYLEYECVAENCTFYVDIIKTKKSVCK